MTEDQKRALIDAYEAREAEEGGIAKADIGRCARNAALAVGIDWPEAWDALSAYFAGMEAN